MLRSVVTASVAAAVLLAVRAAQALGLPELRALYASCADRVLGVAARILRDREEAEDVVQETFLDLWRNPERYDPARGNLEAWVVLVARSRALDRVRSRGRALRLVDRAAADDPAPSAPGPLEIAEGRELGARVSRALAALPGPQREAVELAFFGGLSQAEIAGRVGEPLGTIKTRLRLGMEKLAGHLAEDAA